MALSAALTTEINKPITAPVYLVLFGWSAGNTYYSTRGDVTFDGQTWVDVGCTVDSIVDDSYQGRTVRLSFNNADNAMSTLILARGVRNTPLQIWAAYEATNTIPADQAIQIFNGFITEAPFIAPVVRVIGASLPEYATLSPRWRCLDSVCGHMPPPNTKLKWAGDTYILKPQ